MTLRYSAESKPVETQKAGKLFKSGKTENEKGGLVASRIVKILTRLSVPKQIGVEDLDKLIFIHRRTIQDPIQALLER